jgi:hypothetical protein
MGAVEHSPRVTSSQHPSLRFIQVSGTVTSVTRNSFGRQHASVAGDDAALGIHQNRVVESKGRDARSDLRDLSFGVRGIPGERDQPFDGPVLDALRHEMRGHWRSFPVAP